MMLRTSIGLFRGLTCAALWVTPTVVVAQSRTPRIVVAPFGGERAAVTRSMISGVFSNHTGEVDVASQSEYNAAALRLGVSDRNDEGSIARVAREIRADAVVTGALERRGTMFRLALRVLRGSDGTSLGRASWEFERIEELNAFGNEIWEQLRGYFRVDPALTVTTPTPEPTRDTTEPAPRSTSSDADGQPSTDAPYAEATTPNLGWLHFHLGGGLAGRRWRIPLLAEATQRGYENTAYGELRATLAGYYRLDQNRLGVGLEGSIVIPLGLSSQGRDTMGRTVPIPTSALDLAFGASIARRPLNGGLYRFFVGLTYHSFSLDTVRLSPEMRLATSTYVGLRVAGEGILPLYARREWEFGLLFGAEMRVVAIGAELKEAFGINPGTTVGFGATFGLNLRLDRAAPGLAVRATAEFLRYTTDYTGSARVGTPGASVDDYTRFFFTVVYALGTDRATTRPTRGTSDRYDRYAPTSTVGDNSTAPNDQGNTGNSGGDPFGGR